MSSQRRLPPLVPTAGADDRVGKSDKSDGDAAGTGPTATVAIGRYPCIDGLRFLAAFGVVVHHVWNASDLTEKPILSDLIGHFEALLGLFFLISSFLLYLPFVMAHLEGRPLPRPSVFLWKRALRVLPGYWLALVVIGLIHEKAVLFDGPSDYVFYFGMIWIYSKSHLIAPITQAWTVASEIAWYLLVPVLGVLVCRVRGSLRTRFGVQVAAAGLIAVLGVVFNVMAARAGDDRLMYSQWLPAWFDAVAIGMLFAAVTAYDRARGVDRSFGLDRRFATGACWALGLGGYALVTLWPGMPVDRFEYTPPEYLVTHAVFVLVTVLLILPAVFGPRREGWIRRGLSLPLVAWLGMVSYGIYLWHIYWIAKYADFRGLPPSGFSMLPALAFVIPASIATAAVSYYLLERPVMRWKSRPPWSR